MAPYVVAMVYKPLGPISQINMVCRIGSVEESTKLATELPPNSNQNTSKPPLHTLTPSHTSAEQTYMDAATHGSLAVSRVLLAKVKN